MYTMHTHAHGAGYMYNYVQKAGRESAGESIIKRLLLKAEFSSFVSF